MFRATDRACLGAAYGLLAFQMGQIGIGLTIASIVYLHLGYRWAVVFIPLAAAGLVLAWLSTRGLANMLRSPFVR